MLSPQERTRTIGERMLRRSTRCLPSKRRDLAARTACCRRRGSRRSSRSPRGSSGSSRPTSARTRGSAAARCRPWRTGCSTSPSRCSRGSAPRSCARDRRRRTCRCRGRWRARPARCRRAGRPRSASGSCPATPGPVGQRRAGEQDRARQLGPQRGEHHQRPAALAVADDAGLALGVRVAARAPSPGSAPRPRITRLRSSGPASGSGKKMTK